MDERIIRGAIDEPLTFPLVLSTDHRSPAVGVTPSLVRISKDGGPFAAPAGAVSAVGNGWYQVAGNATDTNTVGPLLLHVEAPACDPLDMRFEIVPTAATDPFYQGSATYPLTFLMIDSADHITGKTGLSPTVTIAKVGGNFATPTGAVAEIGFGWYKVGPNATDYDTPGPLLLHSTATGADATDDRYDVTAVAAPGPGPFRDEDAYLDLSPSIVGLLEDTGAFDEVFHFRNPENDRATSQMKNVATLTHLGGRNRPQPSPFRYARMVYYALTLKVRAQEQEDGAKAAGRFYAICFNALSAKSYGGFTLFEDSALTDDSYDDSRHPEVRVKIRGQFCYVVEAAATGEPGSGLRETA